MLLVKCNAPVEVGVRVTKNKHRGIINNTKQEHLSFTKAFATYQPIMATRFLLNVWYFISVIKTAIEKQTQMESLR